MAVANWSYLYMFIGVTFFCVQSYTIVYNPCTVSCPTKISWGLVKSIKSRVRTENTCRVIVDVRIQVFQINQVPMGFVVSVLMDNKRFDVLFCFPQKSISRFFREIASAYFRVTFENIARYINKTTHMRIQIILCWRKNIKKSK